MDNKKKQLNRLSKTIQWIVVIAFVLAFLNFSTKTVAFSYAVAIFATVCACEHWLDSILLFIEAKQFENVMTAYPKETIQPSMFRDKEHYLSYSVEHKNLLCIADAWRMKHTALYKRRKREAAWVHIKHSLFYAITAIVMCLGQIIQV